MNQHLIDKTNDVSDMLMNLFSQSCSSPHSCTIVSTQQLKDMINNRYEVNEEYKKEWIKAGEEIQANWEDGLKKITDEVCEYVQQVQNEAYTAGFQHGIITASAGRRQ